MMMRFGFVAGTHRDRDPFLAREAAPVDRVARRRLRRLAARFRRLARLGKKDGVVEARLGDIVAPGHARLQFARVARQQHGEAERGGFERAGGRAFGRAVVGGSAFARCAVLHAFAAALGFEQVLGDLLLSGFRAGDRGEAARGAGLSARAEIAGQIPVRGARPRQDFAREVWVEIGMRADEIAAHQVDEALAHGDGRGRFW